MKNLSKTAFAIVLAAGTLGAATAATAATASIVQFDDTAVSGGSISYDGNGGAMIGSNIELDSVRGFATPANANMLLNCISCTMDFTTGANLSEGPGYVFGSGGSITISGTVEDMNNVQIATGTLATGTFTSNVTGIARTNQAAFSGIGMGDLDTALQTYFGISSAFFDVVLSSIALGNVNIDQNGGFLGDVTNADADYSAVPVPATLPLLMAGLLGFGWLRRRA